MTAPWMPPLPEPDVIVHYTADQMRRAQQDAARAALEQAIKLCKEEEDRLWRAYKGHGEPHEEYSPVIEGASDQCAVLADAIRALAREVQGC